jgi:hypothetical protein
MHTLTATGKPSGCVTIGISANSFQLTRKGRYIAFRDIPKFLYSICLFVRTYGLGASCVNNVIIKSIIENIHEKLLYIRSHTIDFGHEID